MMASTVAASLPTPISVATSALDRSATALTAMGSPLSVAPRPCTAAKVSPVMGFRTTPSTGTFATVRPTLTQENG